MVAAAAAGAAARGAASSSAAARTAGGSAAAAKGPGKGPGKGGGKGSTGAGRADRSGPATTSDRRAMKRRAAQADELLQGAYEAGQDGTAWEDLANEVQAAPGAAEAYQSGLDERAAGRRAAVVGGARSAAGSTASAVGDVAGVRGPGWVNDGAGFVLGLLLYALVLNYLRGGPAQARGWLRAKFLNQPYTQSATARLADKTGRKIAATQEAVAES